MSFRSERQPKNSAHCAVGCINSRRHRWAFATGKRKRFRPELINIFYLQRYNAVGWSENSLVVRSLQKTNHIFPCRIRQQILTAAFSRAMSLLRLRWLNFRGKANSKLRTWFGQLSVRKVSLRRVFANQLCSERESAPDGTHSSAGYSLHPYNYAPDEYAFWPDKATSHYAKIVLDHLRQENIIFVEKEDYPANVPEVRPIKDFRGISKSHVHAKG